MLTVWSRFYHSCSGVWGLKMELPGCHPVCRIRCSWDQVHFIYWAPFSLPILSQSQFLYFSIFPSPPPGAIFQYNKMKIIYKINHIHTNEQKSHFSFSHLWHYVHFVPASCSFYGSFPSQLLSAVIDYRCNISCIKFRAIKIGHSAENTLKRGWVSWVNEVLCWRIVTH